jgi:hypothetical protein
MTGQSAASADSASCWSAKYATRAGLSALASSLAFGARVSDAGLRRCASRGDDQTNKLTDQTNETPALILPRRCGYIVSMTTASKVKNRSRASLRRCARPRPSGRDLSHVLALPKSVCLISKSMARTRPFRVVTDIVGDAKTPQFRSCVIKSCKLGLVNLKAPAVPSASPKEFPEASISKSDQQMVEYERPAAAA